jgi:hypothetical protein
MSGVAEPALAAGHGHQRTTGARGPVRRVRHEVRDGLVLMAFSAGTSVGLAVLLTLLAGLGK